MTLRSIIISIILVVIALNTVHAGDPGRWVFDLFRSSVAVTLYEDGSGRAVGPEGETITFCVEAAPCDSTAPELAEPAPPAAGSVYLPAITAARRPTN
jgi:hypothetical protein